MLDILHVPVVIADLTNDDVILPVHEHILRPRTNNQCLISAFIIVCTNITQKEIVYE